MTWRNKIRPLVSQIIKRVGRDDMKALKKALIEGRPSWVCACSWQTKIWRDETNRQLGRKKYKPIGPLPEFLRLELEKEEHDRPSERSD